MLALFVDNFGLSLHGDPEISLESSIHLPFFYIKVSQFVFSDRFERLFTIFLLFLIEFVAHSALRRVSILLIESFLLLLDEDQVGILFAYHIKFPK